MTTNARRQDVIGGIQTEVVVAFAVWDTVIPGLGKELFQEAELPGLVIDGPCQVGRRLTRAASLYPGPPRRGTVKYMWTAGEPSARPGSRYHVHNWSEEFVQKVEPSVFPSG